MSNNLSNQIPKTSVRWIDKICRPLLFSRLEKITAGQIKVIDHFGEQLFGSPEPTGELSAEIKIEEIIVFPWPDRDNLAAEFLAMQPSRAGQLESIAKENLNKNELLAIAASSGMDSREGASFFLRKQASDYSYTGQQAPQPIFDPLAWGRFFKQVNKKKDLSEKEKKMIKILEGENE